jgi:hypothetical protein
MSRLNDLKKLYQSARALRNVSEWLGSLDRVHIDGSIFDQLGEIIFAVDEAEESLENEL